MSEFPPASNPNMIWLSQKRRQNANIEVSPNTAVTRRLFVLIFFQSSTKKIFFFFDLLFLPSLKLTVATTAIIKKSFITMSLQVKLLSATARAPTRGSASAAGYDLYASQATVLPARGRALVPTDISIALPGAHTYGRVAPRSGLALKHGIDTGAGVIDADYRGPVGVILFNHSDADFEGMSHTTTDKMFKQKRKDC